MWHIPNSMLQVAPKKKIAHRQADLGGQSESPSLLISLRRSGNCPRKYRIVALLVFKISLIGRFFLIFDNFENVYLFSNPNILAQTMLKNLKYTWHIHGRREGINIGEVSSCFDQHFQDFDQVVQIFPENVVQKISRNLFFIFKVFRPR